MDIQAQKFSNKLFYLVFISEFLLGFIAILCFYTIHFYAVNYIPWERVLFFGVEFDRTMIIDLLLAIGLTFSIIAFLIMLLYAIILKRKIEKI